MSKQTGLGIAFILVGVAFVNSWFLGILAPDGEIQGLPYNLNIVLCQLLFYVVGIGLIGWKQSRQRLLVLTASALAVVSLYNVFHLDIESAEEREPVAGLQSEQVVLQRVIQLSGDGTAELSMETRPLLYSPGTPVQSRKLLVPDDGVLDTATGIDSRMSLIFDGTAYFRISVASPGEPSKAIYDRRVDLGASDPKAFEWTGVSLDLSEFAGQEIELDFEKGLRQQDSFVSEAYDLTPEDLMFWQEPKLRPKQLSDRPNVILISLDTLRIDHLHHMGYRRETSSNLDSLAKQGTFFTQCISQAPWTTPSHFSIFTSMYPSSHKGNRPIQVTTRFLSSRARTMAEILDDSGYVTAAFTGSGSISAQFGFYRGFDSYNETSRPETGSDIDGILAKSIPWLQNHADRSCFLFLNT